MKFTMPIKDQSSGSLVGGVISTIAFTLSSWADMPVASSVDSMSKECYSKLSIFTLLLIQIDSVHIYYIKRLAKSFLHSCHA